MTRLLFTKAGCALPWLILALLLVVTACINAIVGLGSLSLDVTGLFPADVAAAVDADLQSVTRHLLARVAWGLASIGYSVVAIAAIGSASYILWSCFRELSRRERAGGAWIILCCALPFVALVVIDGDWVLSEPAVTTGLRKASLHLTSATRAVAVDSLFDKLSFAIFLLLATATSATLLWPAVTDSTLALLRRRIARAHWLLYVGGAALTLRALEMFFLYRWPAAWLTGPPADSVDRIALAVGTSYGAFYAGILGSLYLPTAFILRARADLLPDDTTSTTSDNDNAALTQSGLRFSPFQEFGRLLVVLAPLITGGLASKVTSFLSG